MENELRDIAKRLRTLDRSDIRNWLKRGELLTEARQAIGNESGFLSWCRQLQIGRTTAYDSMAAFRNFGSVPTSGRFSKAAMAVLNKSPEAREDAIDLSKHKPITARIAKSLVAEYNPPAVQKDGLPGRPDPEVFEVPGGFVVIRLAEERTDADLLAMLAHAARQVKERLDLKKAA